MKPIGNVPPLGLTADEAKRVHDAVDQAVDGFLESLLSGGDAASQRDVVDAVRRWAARREEEMFPNGRPDTEPVSGSNGDEIIGSASVGYRTYQFQGVAGNGANGASSPPTWPPLPSTAPRFEGDDWKVDAMLLARDAAMKRGHDIHDRPGVPIVERAVPPAPGSASECPGCQRAGRAGRPVTHCVRVEHLERRMSFQQDGELKKELKWTADPDRWLCRVCAAGFDILDAPSEPATPGIRVTWLTKQEVERQAAVAITLDDAVVDPAAVRDWWPICSKCGYHEPKGAPGGERGWRFRDGKAQCHRCW